MDKGERRVFRPPVSNPGGVIRTGKNVTPGGTTEISVKKS
jgi:hypothetical protein